MEFNDTKFKCEKCLIYFSTRHQKQNHEAKFCNYQLKGPENQFQFHQQPEAQNVSYLDEVKNLFIRIDQRFKLVTEDEPYGSWYRPKHKQEKENQINIDLKLQHLNKSSFHQRISLMMSFLSKKDEMYSRFENDVSVLKSKIELLPSGDAFSLERKQIYDNLIQYRRKIHQSEIKIFEKIELLRVRYLKIKLLFYKSDNEKFENDKELNELLDNAENMKKDVFERKTLHENAIDLLNKNSTFTIPDLKSFDQYYDNEILKNIMRLSIAKIKKLKFDRDNIESELITGSGIISQSHAKKHPFIYLAQKNILEGKLRQNTNSVEYLDNQSENRDDEENLLDFIHDTPQDEEENPNDITYF
jgi:hypothetical protein